MRSINEQGKKMMAKLHHKVWPEGRPFEISPPTGTLYENLKRSTERNGEKAALVFYDTAISYNDLHKTVEKIAGYLQEECGVKAGDRVAIYGQNCPQYVMAYYGILRAGAVVVAVNPMNLGDELEYVLLNSGAKAVFFAQDLQDNVQPYLGKHDIEGIMIRYSDYLLAQTALSVPEFVTQPAPIPTDGAISWQAMLDKGLQPGVYDRKPSDLAVFPYTSGSTGRGKGCMHSNETALHATSSIYRWFGIYEDDVLLSIAPFFHVVGMQSGMNTSIEVGSTMVLIPRWDREVTAHCIEKYKISVWPAVPTMIIDLLNLPNLDDFDISTLRVAFGGGQTLPEAVAKKLNDLCGIHFLEGYGLSETICPTTANPPHLPLPQCGGIPVFNTDVIIVDPSTLEQKPQGEQGEILINGPQVMLGYWDNPEATEEAFADINGQRYLRTGDLGYLNENGYVFIVDRIKRMINASGYKVWPAEVEAKMFKHPAINEACIISAFDERRGETVKLVAVLSPDGQDTTAESIISWARDQMAVYKVPRVVEFIEALPKSPSGKVLWRELQELEDKKRNT